MDIPSKDFKNPIDGTCALKIEGGDEKVEISSLSKLTGFPVDYIKKELVLDKEEFTMTQLREHMMVFLNSNFEEVLKEI
jgi:hypothetical protein